MLAPPDRIVALVLAGGAGTRFGGPKQVATVRGLPLVVHAVRAAAGLPTVVVTGAHAGPVAAAVAGEGCSVVHAGGHADGLSASLRRGLEEVPLGASALVLLADQPGVSRSAVSRVVHAARAAGGVHEAVRAAYDGRPGHPVLLLPRILPRARLLEGDTGAGRLLRTADLLLVPCEDVADDRDVDRPEDL